MLDIVELDKLVLEHESFEAKRKVAAAQIQEYVFTAPEDETQEEAVERYKLLKKYWNLLYGTTPRLTTNA